MKTSQKVVKYVNAVLLAKLDITKNKEIIDRFQFSEFPEFILFDQEDQLEFEDELSADALV